MQVQPLPPLVARILSRLSHAEAEEPDPWLRDDLKIARLTVFHAARGDAVECSPAVLASYEVLGLHPDKVWPAICARRDALGPLEVLPVPKKPAQSVTLWQPEEIKNARAVNSRASETILGESREPMSAIPAAYPNSDAPSSEKRGEYSYDELVEIVERSGAPEHVRNLTLAAIAIRGRWPKKQGPVSPVITVSVKSLQDKSGVWRSTIQRRIQRAKRDRLWREVRGMNSWLNCPSCGAEREGAQCPKCPHKGNGLNPNEFRRTYTYAIDIEKFSRTEPCRQVREIREFKQKRGPIPVKAAPPAEVVDSPQRKTAEHQRTVAQTQITAEATTAAQRVFEFCGLADIGLIAKIAIGIVAEAKFRGIGIEDAAKYIAEKALLDQKNGLTLNAFYWRDLKWRTNGANQTGRLNASQQRARDAKRIVYESYQRAMGASATGPGGRNIFDSLQLEDDPGPDTDG